MQEKTDVPDVQVNTRWHPKEKGLFRCNREPLFLGAILLLALILRVAWPTLAEFKFDEARLTALVLDLTREGRLPLAGLPSSAGFAHSPLSVYFYVPAFLFGDGPLTATLYSGLMGVMAVVLCWWLARRWTGSGAWGPRVAAVLLAASPWLVAFSRKVWQITFVPALALVFVGLVISALVQGRRWHMAWALVAYALLVQIHPSAASLLPALLLWLVVFRREVKAGPLALGALLGMLTGVPFLLHQIQNGWPLFAALDALPEAVINLDAVQLAGKAITGSDIHALAGEAYSQLNVVPRLAQTFHVAAWLVVSGLVVVAWRALRDWRSSCAENRQAARTDLVLISWLVVPVVFNLRHSLDLHLHSFALMVPAAYLVVGRAIDTLPGMGLQQQARYLHWVRAVGLAAVGGLVTLQVVALLLMARFVTSNHTTGGFGRPLGQYLAVADQALEIVHSGDAVEVLVVGEGDSPITDATPAIFNAVLRDRTRFRFVDEGSAAVFPPHKAVALIPPRAGDGSALYDSWPAEDLAGGYRLVHLDGSWPADGFEPFPSPRTFENGIELQGYRWQSSAVPGDEVCLWLLWQVLWLDQDNTHFFIHLMDEQNQMVGQQDGEGYPTAYRRAGDRIVTNFRISISEQAGPGPYSARVGMYRYPEVLNLSLLDEGGNPAGEAMVIELGGGYSE